WAFGKMLQEKLLRPDFDGAFMDFVGPVGTGKAAWPRGRGGAFWGGHSRWHGRRRRLARQYQPSRKASPLGVESLRLRGERSWWMRFWRSLWVWVVGCLCPILLLADMAAKKSAGAPPTVADAKAFVEEVEGKLLALSVEESRTGWVQSTYITDDTEILHAQANERLIAATADYAKRAVRFDGVKLPEDLARRLKLLKVSLTLAAP